ncbi:MAG: hypothetical protein GY847_00890 [Proteobacteria bacterium]|nr:hypothetical protein [Pseudomonadota bacterium]
MIQHILLRIVLLLVVLLVNCGGEIVSGIDGLEISVTQCGDKEDNDLDGKIDCHDEDCQGFVFCVDSDEEEADSDTSSDTESDSGGDTDSNTASDIDTDTDSDSDSDTDSDSDSDTDSDSDADTDGDTDTESETELDTESDTSTDVDSDTDTDTDTDVDSDTDVDTDADGDVPNSHWVLWDKNGERVDAIVSPMLDTDERFGDDYNSCVFVSYLGDDYIALGYNLETGQPESCFFTGSTFDSWKDCQYSYFLDDQCSGQAYYGSSQSPVSKISNVLYFTDGDPAFSKITTYYKWNSTNEECVEYTYSTGIDFWLYKPVPDWVLNALPDFPYTVTLGY